MVNKKENLIQQEIVVWFRKNFKNELIFSVPNERTSGWSLMIAQGMLPGVSDLIVVRDNEVLFVEVKDYKGKQSDKQKRFEEKVNLLGYRYLLVRSLEEFKVYL